MAFRSCQHCQDYQYDEDTGQLVQLRDGTPFKRPRGTYAPCRYGEERCPKGTPENSKALSDKNMLAYRHYQECRATGDWSQDKTGAIDEIVKRNAGVILSVEEQLHQSAADFMRSYLAASLPLR